MTKAKSIDDVVEITESDFYLSVLNCMQESEDKDAEIYSKALGIVSQYYSCGLGVRFFYNKTKELYYFSSFKKNIGYIWSD